MNDAWMVVDGKERLVLWWERIPIGVRLTDPCQGRSQSTFGHADELIDADNRGEYDSRIWWLTVKAEEIVEFYLVNGATKAQEIYDISKETLSNGLKQLGITKNMVRLVRTNLRKLPRYE